MRKSCKVLLIIAGILVGMGIIFCALGFAFGGGDFMSGINRNYTRMNATFDEVEIIDVIEVSNDVKIEKSATDEIKVTYSVCEDFSYKLNKSDNKLTIEFEDFRKWYEFFKFIGSKNCDLVIEVPDKTLKELSVKTSSGSIEAKELNCLDTNLKVTSGKIEVGGIVGDLNISSTSGSIQVNSNTVADNAEINGTSGSLKISGDFSGNLKAKLSSGRIDISGAVAMDSTIRNTSGGISAEGFTASSIDASTSSGSVKFKNVTATGDMKVKTTSGSLKLEFADAENYDLKTTSGSINAKILAPKFYDVKATSGSTRTPEFDKNADGVLTARTTSGSIKIELAD